MKKILIVALLILCSNSAFAADTKGSALSAPSGGVAATDKLYIVDDPSGTPVSTADTIQNVINLLLIDEDNMASDSAAYAPTQQSVKAYVDANSGDVTGVGDCASGACLDGSSDGGTYARLYDGDSNYVQLDVGDLSGDITVNLPTSAGTLLLSNGDGSSLTSVDAATGDSASSFFDTGTIEHERGGLEADVSAYSGLISITGGATAQVDEIAELNAVLSDAHLLDDGDIGDSASAGIDAGDSYSNYGVASDDSINELFAAVDTALERTKAFYNDRTALTGGASGALDELSVSDLSDQDTACVRTGSQTEYHYIYDADGTAAENSPSVIRPDDYSTGGNWILQFTIIAGQLQLSEIAENILIADDDATGSWVASGNATAARTMNFIDADSRQVASSDVDSSGHVTEPLYLNGVPVAFCVAASDETTDLTTGTAKVTFRMPYAMTLTAVRASVNTAPVGSTIIVDVNESGTTVLSTKVTIDASEETSETAATEEVVSDSSLANDAEMTIDIDQIGSSTAGKGLKICLIGTRDYN